jgi:hypothetical protein
MQIPETIALACAALLIVAWGLARHRRVTRLELDATAGPERAATGSRSAGDGSGGSVREGSQDVSGRRAAVEGALASLLIPAQALWELSRIDPSVMDGISAASARIGGAPSVDNTYADFLQYISANDGMLTNEGFLSRLLGYVGEQQAADALEIQGRTVEFATVANNPGWDLLIDGEAANVKTYEEVERAVSTASENPELTYILPENAAGPVTLPNMEFLPGFSYSAVEQDLEEGLDIGEAWVTGDAFGEAIAGLPMVLVAFTAYRQGRAVAEGERLLTAITDGVIDIAVRGTGMVLGAEAGAELGAIVDVSTGFMTLGLGTVVGAVVGSIGGSVAGVEVIGWWRLRPLRRAEDDLRGALEDYGGEFWRDDVMQDLENAIWAPVERSDRAATNLRWAVRRDRFTLRWWIWPGSDQVLRREALLVGSHRISDEELLAQRLDDRWTSVLGRPDALELVGLAMANRPDLAARYSPDKEKLDAVEGAFLEVKRVREEQGLVRG